MQKPTREPRQSNDGESGSPASGLELGRAIYSKYVSPGLVPAPAGLGLGQRTTLFGLERLPLLAAIQQRWSSSNLLPSGWPAHHYTWLNLFDRSKDALAPRKGQTSPVAPSNVARTYEANALSRPNSRVAERGGDFARPGSEPSSQLVRLVVGPASQATGDPTASASLHLSRDPGTDVRPLDLTKPSTPNTPQVAGGEAYRKQEAAMVQARSVRLASDTSPLALNSPVTKEIVANLGLALGSTADIAPSSTGEGEEQPRSTSVVSQSEGSAHRSHVETVLATVLPGHGTTAAAIPQLTPAVLTERLAPSIPQMGRAPTPTHISRALKDAPVGLEHQVASKGVVAQISSTNSSPEVLESSAELIGRKLSPTPARSIASGQSFDIEPEARVRSEGPILESLRHPSVAKSGSEGEGSLADQISQPSAALGSSDSEGRSATADQRPSTIQASPTPSKPAPSAGVRVWLSKDGQNVREGSGHVQKGAHGRGEAVARPGNAVDHIGSMVDVAGRIPEIGALAGHEAAKIARRLDSASSDAQSVKAEESSLPRHERAILLRSKSASVASPGGGRDQDLAGERLFVPSPLRQANTSEELSGVERVSRELTHDIARDTEVPLSDGQVPAALGLSTRAEASSKTVALTLANSLAHDSSANEPSSANAARLSGVSIMHLGFRPVSRANQSPRAIGHKTGQAAGIAHRASDPFPPISTAEPVNSTPARPILPDAGSHMRQAGNIDLTQLTNRVYELLVRRLASERQRRGL